MRFRQVSRLPPPHININFFTNKEGRTPHLHREAYTNLLGFQKGTLQLITYQISDGTYLHNIVFEFFDIECISMTTG